VEHLGDLKMLRKGLKHWIIKIIGLATRLFVISRQLCTQSSLRKLLPWWSE
jgi:hypothetical protein